MDLWSLDLDETLRPWRTNGISHILCKDPVSVTANRRVSPSTPAARQVRKAQAPQRAVTTPPAKQAPTAPPAAAPVVASSEIPAPFQALLNRTAIPSFTLWTYWEFGSDIQGEPDPGRQRLWRDMLKALHDRLRWPRGSIAFWPMSTIRDGRIVADLDLFMYGVRRIMPVYVFCFGKQAFQSFFPGREYSVGRYTRGTLSIQVLPGPEEMLPDNKAVKGAAWKIFQRYTPA